MYTKTGQAVTEVNILQQSDYFQTIYVPGNLVIYPSNRLLDIINKVLKNNIHQCHRIPLKIKRTINSWEFYTTLYPGNQQAFYKF